MTGEEGLEGSRICDVTLKFFYHNYETWNLKWCLTFCCNRDILTEGERTKPTPDKTFQTKDPLIKPGTKTPANNWERTCTVGFCPGFCTRPTKMGIRDVWSTFGGGPWGPWMCDSVAEGWRSNRPKIAWRSLLYGRPHSIAYDPRTNTNVFQVYV